MRAFRALSCGAALAVSGVALSTQLEGAVSTGIFAPDSVLPSSALHALHAEMATAGAAKQMEIADRVLKGVQKGKLDSGERLALAELYFTVGDPGSADPAFAEFITGSDVRARVAVQRHFRMKMVAYDAYAGMEDSIAAARRRLPPIADDPWHFQPAVATLATHLASKGDHAGVVRIIQAELAALPSGQAYFSHMLPGMFLGSFQAVGLRDSALAHMRRVRDDIVAGGNVSARGEQPPAIAHRDGVFHRLEEGLMADFQLNDMLRYRRGRLVGVLSGFLARVSGGN
jgi:hypothetical protein